MSQQGDIVETTVNKLTLKHQYAEHVNHEGCTRAGRHPLRVPPATNGGSMIKFIVISLKRTSSLNKAITLWRSDDSGYCSTLRCAGRYDEASVLEHLGYYNSGNSSIAVPAELAERLVIEVEYDTEKFGLCLPNDAETWKHLLAEVICKTDYPSLPEYHRACNRMEAHDQSLLTPDLTVPTGQ